MPPSKLDILISAIERREGFDPTGRSRDLPTRANNPGDLMFAGQLGASPYPVVGTDGKTRIYASFPTVAEGLAALRVQIYLNANRDGDTLDRFIYRYAPASDQNDPGSYLAGVMTALGETWHTDAWGRRYTRRLSDILAVAPDLA